MILDEIIALNVKRQLEAFRLEDAERIAHEVERQVAAFCEEHDLQCRATNARMEQLELVLAAAKQLLAEPNAANFLVLGLAVKAAETP